MERESNAILKGPPSFYDNDVQKFKDKFRETIKKRL